ncbi:NAD(P)H dehydrogenase (quinone) FQR1-like [Arachis duranensis]|uniref:NAD(P)H dehydrogenase (Quinone) FQR1-like n=1 Tax=Arachis duranensis TaxID=130453 RepID=A0A9C6TG42_ARADU|nr:NAD(P)H dehydrogenase (quinone) FQR1-like [Arachis duranensis]
MPPATTVQQCGHRPLAPQPPPHTAAITASSTAAATSALTCKPIGLSYRTGLLGGGQETTPLTAITMLAHHEMIYVPIRYTFHHCMFEMEEVKGGSPYGAGTYAGDVTRQVSKIELLQAFHQKNIFATITKKLKDAA